MPSSAPVRRAVANEVNKLNKLYYNGLIVEAGSGWGTLGIHLAKHCKGWRVVGVENSPFPLRVSQLLAWISLGKESRTSAAFQKGDIYTRSYVDADMVVCYLYPGAMQQLGSIFHRELRPGTRVISVCFALPGWTPEKIVECRDLYRTKVYVYKVE
ncbi:class I SAM-dependent methyltransferase [Paenibacillus sp. SC116]|uniref:class I SAM-dependent methyltransferase n=1 Tax=Paenibacillus sp. SC116 TaxID=2968986 RepID=UPI00281173AB|nr:class I SAM-dependent methyltransferase [Paenibacillus sp. SC116]